jgi:hypothetical protein
VALPRGSGAPHHARLPADRAVLRPALRAALAPAGGGAPHAVPSAAPQSPRPRQGCRFRSRLQRGGEPQHREHLLLQLHQPAWPGKTLALSFHSYNLPDSRTPSLRWGPLRIDLWRPRGLGNPHSLSPENQSLLCPSCDRQPVSRGQLPFTSRRPRLWH